VNARAATLAQAAVEPGGWYAGRAWLTPHGTQRAERRWRLRSLEGRRLAEHAGAIRDIDQCGGCRWFAAFGADDGICYRDGGPYDGMIVFEHGGCARFDDGRGSGAT